jgi:DNA-binding FadR family transcriptional regulator
LRARGVNAIAAGGPSAASGQQRGRTKADEIAADIERSILKRELHVGDVIGSEETLSTRFEVSRPVIREVFRILEMSGMATVRRGPGGGLAVTEPTADPVVAAAERYLEYRGVRRSEMLTTRVALEMTCVEQLTKSMDEAKIAALRATLAAEERAGTEVVTGPVVAEHLHVRMAELSGNVVLSLFVPVLARLSTRATDLHESEWALRSAEIHRAHVAIVDAMTAGDLPLAQHRMRGHLNALADAQRTQELAD